MSVEPERAFLHALSNPLTVIKYSSKKLLESLKKDKDNLDFEKLAERLEKIVKAVVEIEELHASRKEAITVKKK